MDEDRVFDVDGALSGSISENVPTAGVLLVDHVFLVDDLVRLSPVDVVFLAQDSVCESVDDDAFLVEDLVCRSVVDVLFLAEDLVRL